MLRYFSKYFVNKAILLYLMALLSVTFFFHAYSLPFIWFCWGVIEVLLFFYLSNNLTKAWANLSEKTFKKKLFWTSFFISFVYVLVTYYLYTYLRGEPFEYDPTDGLAYHNEAVWCLDMFKQGQLSNYISWYQENHDFSDKGYLAYLNTLYCIFGPNILLARVLKCIYRAWMCILVYKLASRTFGKEVGRMAAIFCMLMPNFSFYAASHRKEMEMLLLTLLFMERTDFVIRSKHYNFINIILPIILAGILFSFRTVLGIAAVFAFLSTLLFSGKYVIGKTKKYVLLTWVVLCLLTAGGGAIANEIEEVLMKSKTNDQETSMEWRSERKGGNQFAKYASGAIFAPLIVVIPFPTMIYIETQENLQRLNGGYFIRNFLAFFILFTLVIIIKQKKWRDFVLIYTFTFSYLFILALSQFAQSERFHLPALPFLLIMAAYGISNSTPKIKRYLNFYMIILFCIIVIWNWFKLAGRSLA